MVFSFRYFSHRHTWEDAEKDCREHSAHLSSVLSSTEQEFINGTCGSAKSDNLRPFCITCNIPFLNKIRRLKHLKQMKKKKLLGTNFNSK